MNPSDNRRAPFVSSQASSRSVFVGSIPFDATEEQLIEIFQTAGPVVSFRLVFDRDSGKPKGYGFCEFKDQETAMSAIRNLNGFEFNNRQLRVDFADSDRNMQLNLTTGPNVMGGAVPGSGAPRASASTTDQKGSWRPNPPFGGGLGLPQNAKQELPNIADTLNTAQLYEIMAKMKLLVQQNADSARTILVQNPQLTTALLHAQVILGMVKPETVQQIINSTPNTGNPTISTPTPTQMPPIPPSMVVPNMMVPPTMGGPINPAMGGPINPTMGGPMGPINPNINPIGMGNPALMVPPTMGGPINPTMGGPMGPMASIGQMNPMVPMSGPINPTMGSMGQINPMGGSMASGGQMKMGGMGSGPMKTMGSVSGNLNTPSFGGMPANPSINATNTPSPEQQQVIIQQLVNLTPEQIERLPPAQRHQILNFKQMYQQQQQQQR